MMGGGGGGGGGTNYSTTETVLPDWVQQQVQGNLGTANTLASQPYTPYPGQQIAGFTPDQTAAFQAVQSLYGTAPGQISQAYNSISPSNLPATIQSLINPSLAGQEQTVIQQAQRQGALSGQQIAANATAVGALGGTREAVQQGLNESQTQANIGAGINNLASNAWTQATTNALQNAGLTAGLAGAGQTSALTDAQALYGVGTQQQTLQQAQYADALSQWQQAQNWPYQQLALAQSALAGSPYGTSVTSSQPYNSNTAATVLSDLAAGAGVINGIPSAVKNLAGAGSFLGSLFGAGAGADAAIGTSAAAGVGTAADVGIGVDAAAGAIPLTTVGDAAAGTAAAGAAAAGAGKSAADAAPFVVAAAA